jgi:hypothetical protein
MTKTTIHLVAGIRGVTLLIFHTETHCWQFQVIIGDGLVFADEAIYYTREGAEEAGRDWIAHLK